MEAASFCGVYEAKDTADSRFPAQKNNFDTLQLTTIFAQNYSK
jgi:hypothetical protein